MMTEHEITHIVVSGTAVWRRREVGSGYLIASCPSLQISLWARTERELVAKQHQAVILTVLYLYGQGILDSFLEARGFTVDVTEASFTRSAATPHDALPQPQGPHVHSALQYHYA